MPRIEEVCEKVRSRITPSAEEKVKVLKVAESLKAKLERASALRSLAMRIRLDGSVAKDTWLRGDADLDIFMLVPTTLSRDEMRTRCLEVAREAVRGHRIIERFAEHPYIEASTQGVTVNLVPAYEVEKGRWLSATDRTPYHTEYVNAHLDEGGRGEIRLLKAFMKGIGTYGADIKTGGFSGMLCETLILNYGSFLDTLRSASDWKQGEVIDVEGYYRGRMEEVHDIFREPLIVIDPVDAGRNLAASVTSRRLWEFAAAARAFLRKPSLRFFFPPKPKRLPVRAVRKYLETTQQSILVLKLGRVEAVVDVLWSQLYRTERALSNILRQNDFTVVRSASWSDEGDNNAIIFELERTQLPALRRHLGPHVTRRSDSEKFLERHLGARDTMAGPWIEGDRWLVAKLRRHPSAIRLLKEVVSSDGGRSHGVAEKVSASLMKGFSILTYEELLSLYRSNPDFAAFFSRYLDGRPVWLTR